MVLECNIFLEEILHKLRCHLHPSSKARLLQTSTGEKHREFPRKEDTVSN